MNNRKVVLEEHEGTVLMGVIQPNCDPYTKTYQGSLEGALGAVPQLLTEAQEKWATSPKMPAYKPPAEPKPAAVPAQKAADLPLLAGEAEPVVAEEKAETPAEEKAEAATATLEPEPAIAAAPAMGPEEAPAEVAVVGEEKPAMSKMAEQVAAPTGQMEYWLKDGRGPYPDVQAAMDAMELDKDTRPRHNRWDRLSTQLKEQIQRRPKA